MNMYELHYSALVFNFVSPPAFFLHSFFRSFSLSFSQKGKSKQIHSFFHAHLLHFFPCSFMFYLFSLLCLFSFSFAKRPHGFGFDDFPEAGALPRGFTSAYSDMAIHVHMIQD